jgi:predicted amidohydrolase
MDTIRIATAQYPIEFLGSWQAYTEKVQRLVGEAAAQGARLLVLPEYASLELASLFSRQVYSSLPAQLEAVQELFPHFLALFGELARRHDAYLLAGTFPVRLEDGSYRNRAYLFGPEGKRGFQDKRVMTRFENERWRIQAGMDTKVFDTPMGHLAINVCYDSEFPLIARAQVAAGASVVLVPSCTDTLAGYHRVRIGCQARALENQCYVIQSCTVGEAPWSEAIDVNVGCAAVYTPADCGFPDDGILAIGQMNRAQWVFADLQPKLIEQVRREGQVFNYRDWVCQPGAATGEVGEVEVVTDRRPQPGQEPWRGRAST